MDTEDELVTILEGIGEGFYAVDAAWRIRRFNRAAERHFRLSATEVLGRGLWEVFPAARDTGLGQIFDRVMETRVAVESETKSVVIDERWLSYRLFPLGDGLGVVFRDITDRKRAEAQRDLLLGELRHRLGNTFATIQAIASQTFRQAQVDQTVLHAFQGRLLSLNRAHAALFNTNWEGLDIHAVLHECLDPYQSKGEGRILLAGPSIRLAPQTAISLTMAVHELCTNAAKYGSLSTESGTLSVQWSLDDRFNMVWRETGGPAVVQPQRQGFGTTMLQRVLSDQLQGSVTVTFEKSGLVCSIDAPAEGVRASTP